MAAKFDNDTVAKAYARWAPVYDLVFGAVFDRGRKASIAAAEQIGGHILEVGVGTGLSLPEYSARNCLTGIDLSAPMLRKAKMRAAQHRLDNVNGLAVMDAQHLGFGDGVFDVVVAQYVITAVPNPEATLDEFVRVLKPGGRLILGDILRPEVGMPRDVFALLRFAAKHGFLKDALIGLVSTALSDYRQLRAKVGLQRYSEAEMIAKLSAAGFSASRAHFNIGHNPWRMTFVARLAFVS